MEQIPAKVQLESYIITPAVLIQIVLTLATALAKHKNEKQDQPQTIQTKRLHEVPKNLASLTVNFAILMEFAVSNFSIIQLNK